MDDIDLTFNPESFLKGFDAIIQGIANVNGNLEKMASNSERNTQKTKKGFLGVGKSITGIGAIQKGVSGIGSVIGSVAKGFAVFGLAAQGLQKLGSMIPEIGRSFSIASNIMFKNFMWPIRKMLLPMLQKFLDWVRDNRALFVKWGNVVANIFRTVISIVKGFVKLLKGLFNRILLGVERVFGKTTNSMTELANLALFKISAIAEFMLITLEPIFKWLGDAFETVMRITKNFFQGFVNGIGDIMPDLAGLKDSFAELFRTIGGIGIKGEHLIKIFRTLGNIVGSIVGPILRGLITTIDLLVLGISNLIKKIQMFRAFKKGDMKLFDELDKQSKKANEAFEKRNKERWQRQVDAWKNSYLDVKKTFDTKPDKTEKTFTKTTKVIDINESRKKMGIEPIRGTRKNRDFINKKNNIKNNSINNINNNTKNNSKIINLKDIKPAGSIKKNNTTNNNNTNNNTTNNININVTAKETPTATAKAVGDEMRDILLEAKFRSGGR